MKKSELRKYISEALTPDEASKVEPKYKETYAAMIRGKGPLKLKKYDNPDKVVLGRVINNLKESTRRTNERLEVAIKEVFSEKQRKYMCVMAQPGAKRPKGLSKADAKEMCADTKISKKMNEGDLDVGHQDDEPRMLKKDIYNMGKYAMEIYKKLDRYDDMEGEVDFPHWWQSKLTKAKSMLQSAYDYLDGEEKITQIDAIMEKEEKLPVNDIKKAIRALLKKEGGAVGLGPILKLAKDFDGVTQIDVEDILDNDMKDVEKHRDGDYILKETGQKISKQNMKGYKEKNKSRLEELVKAALMGPVKEANAYIMAADKARDAGKKEFEFPKGSGKMHPVKLKADIDEDKMTPEERALDRKIRRAYGLDRGAPDPDMPHFKNIFKDDAITIPNLKEDNLDEVKLPQNVKTLANQEVKDAPSMAKAMLDFYNQIKAKETLDFSQNPMMKIALSKLQDLAKKAKVNENKSLSERILRELRGNINEMAGEDLELKSLAKKFIPILKKYQMGVQYLTDTSKFDVKRPEDKAHDVPALLVVKDGVLQVAVYFMSLAYAGGKKDELGDNPKTREVAEKEAAKLYKELIAVLPEGEFEFRSKPEMNRFGNYILQFRLKK